MIVAATHSRKPSVYEAPDWPKVKQPIGEAASREVDSAPAQAAELLEVPVAEASTDGDDESEPVASSVAPALREASNDCEGR
jgi:hypothetical protein